MMSFIAPSHVILVQTFTNAGRSTWQQLDGIAGRGEHLFISPYGLLKHPVVF
jgi:hypothetical protein